MGTPDPNTYLGATIGGCYFIEELVGEGGFAFVFRGRAPGRPLVAIKILHSSEPNAVARFRREIKVLKGLPRNPHVAEYVGDGATDDGRPFLVLEYVEGTTVKEMVARYRRLDPRRAARFVSQLCEAFMELHKLGVAHRDVKPDNILVAFDGQVKLIDFGLIRDAQGILKLLEEQDPAEDRFFTKEIDLRILVGTPEYMAPEQFSDSAVSDISKARTDTWSDVFGLGVILFEMISGYLPFPFKKHAAGPRSRAEIFQYMQWRISMSDLDVPACPGVDPALDSILRKALRRDPRQRQLDALALKLDLDRYLSTGKGVPTTYDSTTVAISLEEFHARRKTLTGFSEDLAIPADEATRPDAQLDAPDTTVDARAAVPPESSPPESWLTPISEGDSATSITQPHPLVLDHDEGRSTAPDPVPPEPKREKEEQGEGEKVEKRPLVIIDLPPPREARRRRSRSAPQPAPATPAAPHRPATPPPDPGAAPAPAAPKPPAASPTAASPPGKDAAPEEFSSVEVTNAFVWPKGKDPRSGGSGA